MLTPQQMQAHAVWVARYEAKHGRWITIGSGDSGGTPVKVDDDGRILAGPAGLARKGIKSLDDFGGKSKKVAFRTEYPGGKTKAMAVARRLLGKGATLEGIEKLGGAPSGAAVQVQHGRYTPNSIDIDWSTETASGGRVLYKDPEIGLVLENIALKIKDQGTGRGTAIFAQQVQQAAEMGVKAIIATAGRSEKMNGYYTWARLGYDADLRDYTIDKLPESLAGAKRVSDLMKTPEGRAWWKENGVQMEMRFDPKPGSLSRKVLDAYIQEREQDGRPIKMDYAKPDDETPEFEPEFDSEDDEILDRIWKEI